MTILHDDGLYRHVRFQRPGSSIYRFDLVTWPGHLSITGDLESYTFARDLDMFEFFASTPGHINPGYWAEKIRAGSSPMEHSPARFKQAVVQHFWDSRAMYPGESVQLFQAIRADVLDYSEYEETARGALDSFRYNSINSYRVFDFADWRDWDLADWSVHYLWSLHAIVWGIDQYRKATASIEVPA
jgi:hypothetical protein